MKDGERRVGTGSGDEELVELVREQTDWGPRTEYERRAFEARLGERLRSRPLAWIRPVPGLATAVLVGLVAWNLRGGEAPAPEPARGGAFLAVAYYAGGSEGVSGSQAGPEEEGYLTDEFRTWTDAILITEEDPAGPL